MVLKLNNEYARKTMNRKCLRTTGGLTSLNSQARLAQAAGDSAIQKKKIKIE